jgi:twinkle protein
MTLSANAIAWLESRNLDSEVADRMGVYSANVSDTKGNSVLVFPYYENGVVVNEKYRLLPKERFWQLKDGRKIFWNVDCLEDPACQDGRLPVIITEGEIDALTVIQCGFPLAMSVPDGAPPPRPSADDFEEDFSGADDQDGKFAFVWNGRDRLERVKRFILAVDSDGPGQRLLLELMRLLSPGRCSFVEYPSGCKDLNDVLMKYGPEAVTSVITSAKQCPVRGLFKASDYPDTPFETLSTGWPLLDQHCKMFFGEFMVITGIPQHGKSVFALNLLTHLAMRHNLRSAIFSPEMPVPRIRERILAVRTGRHPNMANPTWHPDDYAWIPEDHAWLDDMFTIISSGPLRTHEEDEFDLGWILECAKNAIMRDGCRLLLIDPWNEIEHARRKGETMHDYIGWAIRELKRFAWRFNIMVVVVAHPTKMESNRDGTFKMPSLYDVSDSSHWYNKCDHGIIIHRDFTANATSIFVAKSRLEEAGIAGLVKMRLDLTTWRFVPLDYQG